jgi:hypothetical protein
MKPLTFVIVAALAACGRAPVTAGALPAQSVGWMLAQAKSDDLLYVATGDNVYVLSYPSGTVVGSLNVAGANLCADTAGDVYVPTSGYKLLEYAHGGIIPIRTLNDGDIPLGCAVDPVTGNLAVTNEGSGAGEVAIFPNAGEPAQWYRDTEISTYGLCGYDSRGNLFLDGTGSGTMLAELPEGSGTFINFSLKYPFDAYDSIQWDGGYVTLSNPATHDIYRVRFSGSSVSIAGTTRLRSWHSAYSGHWPYVQTLLQRGTFVGQSTALAEVGLWRYPRGRTPRTVIGPFEGGNVNIYGFAMSLASNQRRPGS